MRPGGGTGGARGAGPGEVTAERGSSSGEVGLSRDFSGHGPAEGAENRHREGHPEVLCSSHGEGRGCSRPTAAVHAGGEMSRLGRVAPEGRARPWTRATGKTVPADGVGAGARWV